MDRILPLADMISVWDRPHLAGFRGSIAKPQARANRYYPFCHLGRVQGGSEVRQSQFGVLFAVIGLVLAGCVGDPNASTQTPADEDLSQSSVKDPAPEVEQIKSPKWEVSPAALSTKQASAGEQVTVSWTIKNAGNGEGAKSFTFYVDDVAISSAPVTLSPGATKTVSFSYTPDKSGTRLLKLDTYPSVSLVVKIPADLHLDKLALSKSKVTIGDDLVATLDSSNTGGDAGSFSVPVMLNSETVGTVQFSLNGGQTGTQTIKIPTTKRGVNTVSANGRTEQFTALQPATFEYGDTVGPSAIVPTGTAVQLTSTIKNTGDVAGDVALDLTVNGAILQSQRPSLEAGEVKTAKFEWTPSKSGIYTLAIGKGKSAPVTVKNPAKFDLSESSVSAREIVKGGTVTYHVRVTNSGELEGTAQVIFKVDGAPRATESRSIQPGAGIGLDFAFEATTTGTYSLSVNDLPGIQVKVLKPAEFTYEALSVSPTSVNTGDAVTISVNVRNIGEVAGTASAPLVINGVTVQTRSIVVQPGAVGTVTFTYIANDAGQLPVQVGSSSVASLTVKAPAMTGSATHNDAWCSNSVSVTVTVKNEGVGIAKDVEVYAYSLENGLSQYTEDTRAVGTMNPGETKTVTLNLQFRDDCGESDTYSATISITPSNGARYEFVKQIKDI